MAKKEKLNVKVITAPNGYVLDIGSHGFFYFTLDKLLEGEVSVDKIGGILEAAGKWKDNAKLVKQIIALEHENKTLKLALEAMDQDMESKKVYAKSLREKLAEKNSRIKELEEILKEHPNWLRK